MADHHLPVFRKQEIYTRPRWSYGHGIILARRGDRSDPSSWQENIWSLPEKFIRLDLLTNRPDLPLNTPEQRMSSVDASCPYEVHWYVPCPT